VSQAPARSSAIMEISDGLMRDLTSDVSGVGDIILPPERPFKK